MRADPKKFFPIANGVDISMFKPMKAKKPKEWGDGFHVITTRRLVPKTGIQFLIPALKPIIKERPDTNLVIYGDGPMLGMLKGIARECDIEGNVHFMGPAPYSEMPRIYNAADVVAIPSLIEATSLSCLEAMACGKTLVTCPVGGVPEIAPRNMVIYTKPGDVSSLELGLRRAITGMSQKERNQLGAKAQKHVGKSFTWQKTVDKVVDVYEMVLRRKN